jgi:hypothetical protein
VSKLVTCRGCGVRYDLSQAAPEERVTCGGCGRILTEPSGKARPSPRRTQIDRKSAEEAKARLRAAKLCITALYLVLGGVAAFFLIAGALAGVVSLVAVVLAVIGRIRLAQLGPGPRLEDCRPGIERLASRTVPRAERHALAAILLGGGMTVWCAFMIVLAVSAGTS